MTAAPSLKRFASSPDLRRYVRGYLQAEAQGIGGAQVFGAWARPLMMFQYGMTERFAHTLGGTYTDVYDANFFGVLTTPCDIYPKGDRTRFLLVDFTPVGAYLLFRESGRSLLDRQADAIQLVPSRRRWSVAAAVHESNSFGTRLALIERFLRSVLPQRHIPAAAQLAERAGALILAAGGAVRVEQVAAELNVTDRHLRRAMVEVTGVSPKKFARMARFSRAISELTLHTNRVHSGGEAVDHPNAHAVSTAAPPRSLAERALDLGFTDQAHFSNELKAFSGFSPGALDDARFQFFAQLLTLGERGAFEPRRYAQR